MSPLNDRGTAIAELWLEELGTLTGQILHDVRNALQGVAVNLEVIRSRAASENAAGGQHPVEVGRFAENASRSFVLLSRRVDAMLYLCRGAGEEADVAASLRAIADLYSARGEQVKVVDLPSTAKAAVSAEAARLILSRAIGAALKSGGPIECTVRCEPAVAAVVQSESSAIVELDQDVLDVTRELHVHVDSKEGQLVLTFPTTLRRDTVFA